MQSNQRRTRIIDHKALRLGIGVIAILMPLVVQLLSGHRWGLSSISVSYWTDSGDIFVGSLTAIAFFLAAYNGTGDCRKDTEYWISKFAGLFALIVALIPTTCATENCGETPRWVEYITFGNAPIVHNVAAILLFVCLFLLITFFSRRAEYKGKHGRSHFYFAISMGMLIGMPSIYLIGLIAPYQEIYWVEVLGLVLFGAGWLVAGWYKTEPVKDPPKSAEEIWNFNVDPKNKNNPTNIVVEPGARYLFKSEGCWKDSFLSCGPTGWGPSWNWWTKRNRLKGQPVFMLCGNIGMRVDNKSLAFAIGTQRTWTAPEEVEDLNTNDRKLYLFANDWKNKYHNNSGYLKVTIYKLN